MIKAFTLLCILLLHAIQVIRHILCSVQKLYVTMFPCNECAKVIIQVNLKPYFVIYLSFNMLFLLQLHQFYLFIICYITVWCFWSYLFCGKESGERWCYLCCFSQASINGRYKSKYPWLSLNLSNIFYECYLWMGRSGLCSILRAKYVM